jgi:catechol 2,3-dioxygenase-like lactoylglutathione lyase family enzyme
MSTVAVKRLDHVSFTVGDLNRSVAFYQRFGLQPIKSYSAEGSDTDEGTATTNAAMEIVWLGSEAGDGPMLELIRYLNYPIERSVRNSKVGAAHLCFAVEDVWSAYERLDADGIEFLSAPHRDEFGVQWVYFRDPDGNVVEMIEDPPGTA